jgi:dynein light chain LC8-type
MAERKAVIKNADMSEDMQQDAVDCASQALEKYNIEKASLHDDYRLHVTD